MRTEIRERLRRSRDWSIAIDELEREAEAVKNERERSELLFELGRAHRGGDPGARPRAGAVPARVEAAPGQPQGADARARGLRRARPPRDGRQARRDGAQGRSATGAVGDLAGWSARRCSTAASGTRRCRSSSARSSDSPTRCACRTRWPPPSTIPRTGSTRSSACRPTPRKFDIGDRRAHAAARGAHRPPRGAGRPRCTRSCSSRSSQNIRRTSRPTSSTRRCSPAGALGRAREAPRAARVRGRRRRRAGRSSTGSSRSSGCSGSRTASAARSSSPRRSRRRRRTARRNG